MFQRSYTRALLQRRGVWMHTHTLSSLAVISSFLAPPHWGCSWRLSDVAKNV